MNLMSTASAGESDPFGLYAPSIFQAPHETYHLLRHADPVHWDALTSSWIITRYADVLDLLSRPRQLSSALKRPAATSRLAADLQKAVAPIEGYLVHWLLDLAPPAHPPGRMALNRCFTAATIASHAPRMAEIASDMAQRFVAAGGGDFVADVAHPFPVRVIAELIGVPPDDLPRLTDWFVRLSAFFQRGPADRRVLDDAADVIAAFDEWLADLLDRRKRRPRSDLLTAFVHDPDLDGLLDSAALRSTVLLLLFAGHESSRSALASGMLAFEQTPEAVLRLRREPGMMPSAVEEILRFEGPFMRQDRVVATAMDWNGRRLQQGDRVVLVLGAANRDPARFHAPDSFQIGRANNRHLAFGHGAHFCLGSRLAQIEIAICLTALIAAAPNWAVGPRRYSWREHFNSRGLAWLDLRPA
ncbi:MAG: cytochrome P450 [Brevundimonas sp.]|nr:cytochrome P450 [Brevundimonas sp.]